MKLFTVKQIKEEKEVELPVFYKKDNDYYALLHEKTLLNVFLSDNIISCRSVLPEYNSDFSSGFDGFEPITEQEFFHHWEKAYKELNIMPQLVNKYVEPVEDENGQKAAEDSENWTEKQAELDNFNHEQNF